MTRPPTTKQTIRDIQHEQANLLENKLRFIADNIDLVIHHFRVKQAEELLYYSTESSDIHSLWRGSPMESWVLTACIQQLQKHKEEEE